jgi:hypothetical protein
MSAAMTAERGIFAPRGVPAPAALVSARVELHWAAQLGAAVGRAAIPAVPDDSHTSLEWVEPVRALVGGAIPRGLRLGLRPADLTLLLCESDGRVARELALAGRTLEEARGWVSDALCAVATVLPPYEMPPHAVARGGVFGGGESLALAELGRWYAAADRLLCEACLTWTYARGHASPVRCWPHHFDIATLIDVSGGASGEARTIGVGLSPGDASYAEPYFYVTPWPALADPALTALPGGGAWHRTGWFGAVLTGSAIFAGADGSPSTRAEVVSRFLDVAAGAAFALLDSDRRGP